MLEVVIIERVEESEWISMIVVQDKKTTSEVHICIDLRKLNDTCLHDSFPTLFTDEVLESVGGQEVYSFIDGLYGYHQVQIAKEYRHKTTFVTEWGCFQYTLIPFGLKNSLVIFSRLVVAAFKYFIRNFLEVYFDDWTVFGLIKYHIGSLKMMLEWCRQYQILLNLKKCIVCGLFGILLGHVVRHDGIMVNLAKITTIVDLPPPTTVKQLRTTIKQLRRTLGHTRYYQKFIKGYAEVTNPMEKLLKKCVKFQWSEDFQEILYTLKKKIVTTPILVFSD